MKKLSVKGLQGSSKILIGENLSNLAQYIPENNVLIITDDIVNNLYCHLFPAFPVVRLQQGESFKTLESVQAVVSKMLELGVDRSWFIVGIGGGIVCDVTGFIASIYMRGLRFGFVSTTLLSQVDASVGGKNGVNFEGYKNILGVFNQPEFVICDALLLDTLSDDDILCGLAEIIKHALIADVEMFSILEQEKEDILCLDNKLIEKLVYKSVKLKARIVNEDEHEQGNRKLLNFGHTIGHAIEKVYGIPHGQAVAVGMKYAIRLSVNKGYLKESVAKKIFDLIHSYGYPELKIDELKILSALLKDKKKDGDDISFIYLKDIGEPLIKKIAINDFKEDINELFKHSL
ncbi:MAG: 3-dehydroquinate synthase [Candidatus Margulisbacteria bacterium]|nr:3-dehydroquinate synthase [Candidatus Margulisiibacteriota bacterium]